MLSLLLDKDLRHVARVLRSNNTLGSVRLKGQTWYGENRKEVGGDKRLRVASILHRSQGERENGCEGGSLDCGPGDGEAL